ncbi:hypothetical protein F8M41_006675 [Gigaspora margarita]|uniref:Uncharacterized protein n=1 Tax=Gigaspora margarita TaxID=4874 RepID=A0A8H4AWS8_GIGMA|nr:hypothetical protein F8M41_006675 [Gigaspora margarita]
MFIFASVALPEVLSSSQVTSDFSVPKRQFWINNPTVPPNYKQKEISAFLSSDKVSLLICYLSNDSSARSHSSVLPRNSPVIKAPTR